MKLLYSLLLVLSVSSCDFPRHYFEDLPECNSTLDTHNIESKIYNQAEVVEILKKTKPDQYRYKFKSFVDNEKYAMIVSFRTSDQCMDVKMKIGDLDKLEGMYRTGGYSYPKELYDLLWVIKETNGIWEVHYMGMHDIID